MHDPSVSTISPFVRRLVRLMEGRFRLPGTEIRFGLDAVLGIVPGFGDFLGMVIGLVLVFEAWRLKIPVRTIARMLLNLWLDAVIGSIPVLGDLFDFYFKAHHLNLRLLEKHTSA